MPKRSHYNAPKDYGRLVVWTVKPYPEKIAVYSSKNFTKLQRSFLTSWKPSILWKAICKQKTKQIKKRKKTKNKRAL